MRLDHYPLGDMVHPDDYRECTLHGVHLQRRGAEYVATDGPSRRVYRITGKNSQRLPWRVWYEGKNLNAYPNLPAAASFIAQHAFDKSDDRAVPGERQSA